MIDKDDESRLLLELMCFVSEDEFYAGWYSGLEELLYKRVFLEKDHRPMFALMRELAEKSGYWWEFNDKYLEPPEYSFDGNVRIPLAEAARRWGKT